MTHTIHVTRWDGQAWLELQCDADSDAPCRWVLDDIGERTHVDECNAVDWWDQTDPDDLIHGTLDGPPPWPVDIEWHGDDGPHVVQVKNDPQPKPPATLLGLPVVVDPDLDFGDPPVFGP